MSLKKLVGLIVGLGGLAACFVIDLPGLSFPGTLTLGIFWMAAVFWITEPVPIFATSMLVIFMQVVLLSNQGPINLYTSVPTTVAEPVSDTHWSLPSTALTDHENPGVYVQRESDRFTLQPVTLVAEDGSRITVTGLSAGTLIVATDATYWKIHYTPQKFGEFYAALASPIIILFLGGFALAAAAVKYGLDLSLTRVLLRPFGSRPAMVCLGLMLVTALLSAFMSNTATTAMMMTVVLPIIAQLQKTDPFRKVIALSIPVAANIGGIATPIGSPPNAIALAALREQGIAIAFSTWMAMAVPLMLILLVIGWQILLRLHPPALREFKLKLEGRFNRSPKALATYIIFGLTVLLWTTEKLHGIPASVIAFLPVALLPAIGVLGKEDIRGFSWEVLWLVAGGISLGLSMQSTGMADWLVSQIGWQHLGGVGLVIVFALVGFVIANLISHTVSATMLIPLAVGLALSGAGGEGFDLASAIIIIAVVVSFSMVLPISTPPNAIAMSSGMIETADLAKSGLIIGLIGFVATVLFGLWVWPFFLNSTVLIP